jgi:hypothetical protein
MPETSDIRVTTAQLTAGLAGLIHGPYADASTAGAAELAAEAVRYLNHASARSRRRSASCSPTCRSGTASRAS